MAQQIRRAPGRPKKTQETTVVEQPVTKVVSKKPPIRQKTEEVTHRIYEISKGGGVVTILRQKEIQIYDEESGQIRNLRYCPRENSPYVDEQSENSVREAVIFRDGRLLVPKEKPNLMKFLDLHPENQANGGHLFKLIDDKKDAEQELAKEFSQSEAIMMVREKDIQDLLPVAIYYGININRATSEIRYDLLQTAKKNPMGFINLKKSGVYWFDSNQMIVSVPAGMEPVDVMTRFCLTEKGAAVLSTLEDKLEKLG